MLLNVKDTDVNYVRYGKENSQAIVYLHGWGQNIQMMKPVADPFQDKFDIVILIFQVMDKVVNQNTLGRYMIMLNF